MTAGLRSRLAELVLGPPFALRQAPARVRAAIAESEAQAEILVGWAQLAGVAAFLLIYLASRSAFVSPAGMFEPVPLSLLAYGGVTAVRLRLAAARALAPWMLWASAALDVVLFMFLIWSFHLQYHAPAAIYLKAPTLLYLFILIALRALRHGPALVLFTGGLGALGWLALAAYAGFGPDPAPATMDYRVYMSSLSVLWGAELEKVAAIAAVSALLAIVVARGRRLLFRTATEEAAAAELSRFVGEDVSRRVRAADRAFEAGQGEIKRAVILSLDLAGFTHATATKGPEAVIALLKDYHARMIPVIEDHGGVIYKFEGDGVLASFGCASPSERPAAEALAATAALLEAADAWAAARAAARDTPLAIRVALTAGDVVYGPVGFGDRLEYAIIGDAMNVAAKLEKHAKTLGARALAARNVVEEAALQGYIPPARRDVPQSRVPGVDKPVDLVILA